MDLSEAGAVGVKELDCRHPTPFLPLALPMNERKLSAGDKLRRMPRRLVIPASVSVVTVTAKTHSETLGYSRQFGALISSDAGPERLKFWGFQRRVGWVILMT